MKHLLSGSAVVLLAALLIPAAPAEAQSPLAAAARREAERRKAAGEAKVPVYTDQDLARLPPRAAPVRPALPPTSVTTAGVGGETREGAAAADPQAPAAALPQARDEAYWRERIGTARANLSRAEIFAESLQSRINALTADFTARDDPAQRQQLFEQRERALLELERVKAEVAAFTRQIADIEEEARRAGVPPGWLR